jgi:hypothetical protein
MPRPSSFLISRTRTPSRHKAPAKDLRLYVSMPCREHAVKSSSLNYLRTLELSCASFCSSRPLFSTACALFDKNRGVGTSAKAQLSRPSHLPVVFFALCFHILTNCFSRKLFVFTTIRIARGCGAGTQPFIDSVAVAGPTRLCVSIKIFRTEGRWREFSPATPRKTRAELFDGG